MNTILTALQSAGLISSDKAKREINRKEKIRIMESQLARLYKAPTIPNMIRIENLETALAMFRR